MMAFLFNSPPEEAGCPFLFRDYPHTVRRGDVYSWSCRQQTVYVGNFVIAIGNNSLSP